MSGFSGLNCLSSLRFLVLYFQEWGAKWGPSWRTDLLSLCPHPLSLPKAAGVFLEPPSFPPSVTTAAKKKKNLSPLETLLHLNEAILWGFVMVRHPQFPLRETFSSSVNHASPLSHVHSYSSDKAQLRSSSAPFFLLSLFFFHVPQISFNEGFPPLASHKRSKCSRGSHKLVFAWNQRYSDG